VQFSPVFFYFLSGSSYFPLQSVWKFWPSTLTQKCIATIVIWKRIGFICLQYQIS
jgi:hypothetical protein